MKSATRSLFFFTALLSASHSYAGMLYNNFASCAAVIDGAPIELDFFSQYESDKPTGLGFSVQTTFGLKIMSQLKLKEGQRGMNVEMFTALEPDVLFAEFVIPDSPESEVTIFAKTWGNRAWGNFTCTRK